MYLRLNLHWDSGEVGGVVVARGFAGRLLGVRLPGASSVLLWTASVHTFGLKKPIRAIFLTTDGIVEALAVVPPRQIRRRSGLGWVLELPTSVEPPGVGMRIDAVPWGDVRNPHPVRNADRQSR